MMATSADGRAAAAAGSGDEQQRSLSVYEKIMGRKDASASAAAAGGGGGGAGTGGASADEATADAEREAANALSNRLATFRRWLTDEANVQLHPALCVVNGEATDGTRNAPVLVIEKPKKPGGVGAAGGGSAAPTAERVGAVDWEEDQALYDRTMGCQVRAVREIKKDEVILDCPRGAMVTPDLVASSDAGRAVLACCRKKSASVIHVDGEEATSNGGLEPNSSSGSRRASFWDAFENTATCESRYASKHSRNTSPQLLVKILTERKKAETAYGKRLQEQRQQLSSTDADNGGGDRAQLKYSLAEPGTVSTRAPLLAFLIHQRFADEERPPVISESDEALEQFASAFDSGDGNALASSEPVIRPPGSPETFAPYARTLPSSVSVPLCWKRSELALLAAGIPGSKTIQDVASRTSQLVSEFIALLDAGILERFPDTFPAGLITWERWVWAAAIVSSRALPAASYIDEDNDSASAFVPADPTEFQSPADIWGELGVLIPLLDMLNHEIDAHQVTWQPCVPGDAMKAAEGSDGDEEEASSSSSGPHGPRAIVHKKVRKGSELFCCYGVLSNSNLLTQYGFAQIANPADEVKLGWGLCDAVGHLDVPEDYESPLKDDSFRRFYVFETTKDEETKTWWTDDRLMVLETELGSQAESSFIGSLKSGQKMAANIHGDKTYNPVLLTALVVATMPKIELQRHISMKKDNLVLTRRHQQVLRSYLAYLFSRKLEKLLQNVNTGLMDHFGSIRLWTSATKGGIRYKPEEGQEAAGEDCVGWQTFFDAHAYKTTMEVEKHYYAMGADSCVLTLYDGQLRALQTSLEGVCDDDQFRDKVLRCLEDIGYGIDKSDPVSPGGDRDSNGNSSPASDNKKSPRTKIKKTRNSKSTVAGPGASSDNTEDRPKAMKLHVGNLSFATTPSEMYDYFCSLYGKDNILECHIPIERDTGRSRGFGFVTMPEDVAMRVLESGAKHEMSGRLVKLAKSNSAGAGNMSGGNRGRPTSSSSSTGDRCQTCGYRPRYCTCGGRGGGGDPPPGFLGGHPPPPPPPPGAPVPPGGPPRHWDDRDYSYYGGDRHRDFRGHPPPIPPPNTGYGYDRDMDRDRYGRPFDRDRDRYSSRYDEPPPPSSSRYHDDRYPDDRYYEGSRDRDRGGSWRESRSRDRDRDRDRSRSSGRRDRDRDRDRDRGYGDYDDDRRYTSSRRGGGGVVDDDYEGGGTSSGRRKRSRSRSPRSRSRSGSRSPRERSRRRRSSKRSRARSRSRSPSSSPRAA